LTRRRFIWAGVRHHVRAHLVVTLGVVVAVAVLCGSLLVGHSARETLRELNLKRLGPVVLWIHSHRAFPEDLATRLGRSPTYPDRLVVPTGLLAVMASATEPEKGWTVPGVEILGVNALFWDLFPDYKGARPKGRDVLVSRDLARDMGLKPGDALLIQVRQMQDAPMASLFGRRRREDVVARMRLTVLDVLEPQGVGSFHPGSKTPRSRTLLMDLPWLQERLEERGKINRLLLALKAKREESEDLIDSVTLCLNREISLEDLGWSMEEVESGLWTLRTDRLVFPQAMAEKVREVARKHGLSPVLSSIYLANSILVPGEQDGIPYSVVASLDPFPGMQPLQPQEILLSSWAAEDLQATVDDPLDVSFLVIEPTNALHETWRSFTVQGILPTQNRGVGPWLVPQIRGVTDGQKMRDWEPPFPVDRARIREKDEAYWERFGTTPKAFLSPKTLQDLWGSGDWITTVIFFPKGSKDVQEDLMAFQGDLSRQIDPAALGFSVVDLRRGALDAATGSTDFAGTFLAMSFFLVASAAGWVGLLIRLNVRTRAKEYGVMAAVGFGQKTIAGLMAREAILLAWPGTLLGVPAGILYAQWVLKGLQTRWQGALGEFVFELHLHPRPLLAGWAGGLLVAWGAVRWGIKDLERRTPLGLLWGWGSSDVERRFSLKRGMPWSAFSLSVLVIGLFLASTVFSLMESTLAYFAMGACLLTAFLLWMRWYLQCIPKPDGDPTLSLWKLSWTSARIHRLRSLLTFSIMGIATFILVTVAANEKDLTRSDVWDISSGTGGFSLMVSSQIPLFEALDAGKEIPIFPMRVREGDDVSCLNLQRPEEPRVLGVSREFMERGGFRFSAVLGDESRQKPWMLLEQDLEDQRDERGQVVPVVPAVMDASSAQWILKKKLGDTVRMRDLQGRWVHLQLVGFLADSLFASEVLIAESQLVRLWGEEDGYRRFLLDVSREDRTEVAFHLRESLGELGVEVFFTEDVLAEYAQVQNAYLGAFQLLGGISLLWASLGVSVSLLRGVVERRRELAMMLAVGLSRGQLAAMIVLENAFLLLLGVFAGTSSALIAVLPHLTSSVARFQWTSLAATLWICVVGGLFACGAAAAVSVGRDILSALRSE